VRAGPRCCGCAEDLVGVCRETRRGGEGPVGWVVVKVARRGGVAGGEVWRGRRKLPRGGGEVGPGWEEERAGEGKRFGKSVLPEGAEGRRCEGREGCAKEWGSGVEVGLWCAPEERREC